MTAPVRPPRAEAAADTLVLSRRALVKAAGAVVVAFSAAPTLALAQSEEAEVVDQGGELPGSLADYPHVDAWIRIGSDDSITVFTGKAELGQGIRTALSQIAAEQLRVAFPRITLITADTARTPNEGYTAASHSLEESGTAILHAAGHLRGLLAEFAAEALGAPAADLTLADGVFTGPGGRTATYGQLVEGRSLHVRVTAQDISPPDGTGIMATSVPRIDIPGKLTGAPSYVHDFTLPGMVHARLVRPPRRGARLAGLDAAPVERLPGVLRVVRDGDYLAVIAEGEWQAVVAMNALAAAARWEGGEPLPTDGDIHAYLQGLRSEDSVLLGAPSPTPAPPGSRVVEATFTKPYQLHGSIGPSCAVGLYDAGRLTVWSPTQGAFPDRAAIAEMVGMAEDVVRVVHMEGAGCYGHNGADDAGADAALLARALPSRPVRVQWMREDEHRWEPYGSAMVVTARGSVSPAGEIDSWNYEVWSNPHSTRPGPAGNLLPAQLIAARFAPAPPGNIPQPAGGADRNALPGYTIPGARAVEHFIPQMPIRTSALRSLGAYMNVFALESLLDDLARAAGADPVAFRLVRLEDPRARDVVTAAAEAFDWNGWVRRPGFGRGFGYARYKNLAAYCAVALEVEVEPSSGRIRLARVVAACDSGQVVNPDGIRNQIEGGIVQSASWTLFEEVRFDETGIRSIDWAGYPILRFGAAPESVEVHVVERPGAPFLGTGEGSQGPTVAAIGNAVADATGVRLTQLPFRPERVRAALAV